MRYETYASKGLEISKTLDELNITHTTKYVQSDVPCESKFVIESFPKTPLEAYAVQGIYLI